MHPVSTVLRMKFFIQNGLSHSSECPLSKRFPHQNYVCIPCSLITTVLFISHFVTHLSLVWQFFLIPDRMNDI
jgi:hypothetical protein